jgi:hypothetical protein
VVAQVGRVGGHQQDLVLRLERALEYAHQHDDADVIVEPGIDDERFEFFGSAAFGRRHARDHRLQDLGHVLAGLRADAKRIVRVDADHVLDLLDRLHRIRGGKIDLVQHRDHFHALLDGGVAVRYRLRLDAL